MRAYWIRGFEEEYDLVHFVVANDGSDATSPPGNLPTIGAVECGARKYITKRTNARIPPVLRYLARCP